MTLPDLTALSVEGARLIWVASDETAVAEAAALAERELAAAEGPAVPRLFGYLGNAYRLLGRHEEAISAHERAAAAAASGDDRRALMVALARLGESFRCAERYDEAEPALRRALELAPADLRHFALQHLGKTLLDRGAGAEAAEALEEALRLRRGAGDEELVRSTERALAAARAVAREGS